MLLWVGGVAILASSILIAVFEYQHSKQEMSHILHGRVEVIEGTVEEMLRQEQAKIEHLVNDLADSGSTSVSHLMESAYYLSSQGSVFYLLNRAGRIELISNPERYGQFLGLDFSHLDFVIEMDLISSVYQSLITRRSVISLLTAIGDGRMLVVEKDLQDFVPLLNQFGRGELIQDEMLFVLSEDGAVIYHPETRLIQSRHNLGLELRRISGPDTLGLVDFHLGAERYYGVEKELSLPMGWRLYNVVPTAILTAHAIEEILIQVLVLVGLIIMLMLTMGWLLQRYYSRPVADVIGSLSNYQSTDLQSAVPVSMSKGILELSDLINAVNRMFKAIFSTQKQLEEREELFRTVTEHSVHWSFWLKPDGRIRYISPSCERMTGFNAREFYQRPELLREIIHPEDRQVWDEHLHQTGRQGEVLPMEFRIQTKQGHIRWIRHFCKPIIADDGTNLGSRGANIDVSEEKRAEQQLVHNSLYDSLTGLANRDLFMDRLSQVIKRCEREDFQFAVLFLDLDRFKNINDSLGHRIGDLLLKSISLRLQDECRPSDTVARLGGDEFAALLEGVGGLSDTLMFAERIRERVREPYRLENYEIFTSISVGITMSHGSQRNAADLLRDADTAMYHAKSRGRDKVEVFDAEMHNQAVERLNLENDLRRAIERREFVNFYQAIFDLQNNRISGFESLVRWQHPERGLIPPGEFITLAEETGIILPLGKLVMQDACRQLQVWQRIAEFNPLTMNINLSGVQLTQPGLAKDLQGILQKHRIDVNAMALEITETVLMEYAGHLRQTVTELEQMGVQLCMDDFGTGYSSLNNLRNFPISKIKIDRAFISHMLDNEDDRMIVRAIIDLAHNLGMDCIAEGVESEEQCQELCKLGCDFAQGLLFSEPLTAEEAWRLVSGNAEPRTSSQG
ncbi:MAG: EAL domain-containing protein [Gammaproteobacteria bacterium]|nr:EAL domain-containing protein [Gammaproteobacteria bacterium]